MSLNFHIFKVNSALLLLIFAAILSSAVSPVSVLPQQSGVAETVFCPLTKKLQPVHPPKNNLLDEFCASSFEKEKFSRAIIEQFTVKFNNFTQKNLENLVFDYWQNEKTAFANLPNQPFQPEKTLARNSFSNAGLANKFEHQIAWKTAGNFSFQLNQRPPPVQKTLKFDFQQTFALENVSRNIKPRSPPLFS